MAFCCIKKKLVLELDGSQHLDQSDDDEARTAHLQAQGYRILRFWNNEVQNDLNSVICSVLEALKEG